MGYRDSWHQKWSQQVWAEVGAGSTEGALWNAPFLQIWREPVSSEALKVSFMAALSYFFFFPMPIFAFSVL